MSSFQSIFLALQCVINLVVLFTTLTQKPLADNEYHNGFAVIGLAIINITLEAIIIFGFSHGD